MEPWHLIVLASTVGISIAVVVIWLLERDDRKIETQINDFYIPKAESIFHHVPIKTNPEYNKPNSEIDVNDFDYGFSSDSDSDFDID